MSGWSEGYVAEIDYTHGFYKELTPIIQELACFSMGLKAPNSASNDFNYLELGFGQGLSFNIHAATNPGTFWGTDFNPRQAFNAQELAKASGANVVALEQSFQELAQRDDLPDFDVIALHGIWSWISDENRGFIVDIARRKLKPGGIFYISYNVTPGWSPAMPLRHLMSEYVERQAEGSISSKIDAAIEFSQSVADLGVGYFAANPGVLQRLEKLKEHDRKYLAHEYFNADWHPMPFSKAASILADAKLEFGASCNLLDHVDPINLKEDSQTLLNGIHDPIMKQTTRDYLINQQFRKDLFLKGANRLDQFEFKQNVNSKVFVLLSRPGDIPMVVNGPLGDADLTPEVYSPIIDYLGSDNYQPKSFKEIYEANATDDITIGKVWQALQILCGMSVCAPTQNYKTAKQVAKKSLQLNREIWRRAEFSNDIGTIAAPLIGSGIPANRFEQLFLSAIDKNLKDPVQYVSGLLTAQGQKIIVDDQPIEDEDKQVAELTKRYENFKEKRLPIMKKLLII